MKLINNKKHNHLSTSKNTSRRGNYSLPTKLTTAFTLAEVLITLGIIGVVAAITIPMLINNYQEKTYKTQYKKIFSELNQAMKSLQYDEKAPSQTCSSFDDSCFRDLFAEKLKVSHKCKSSAPNLCQQTSKFLDNSTDQMDIGVNTGWPSFVTISGYSVKFRFHFSDCNSVDELVWDDKKYGELKTCGWVQVDTNGLSKPNTVGKDIFFLEFMSDGFVPVYYGDNKENDCKKGTGISCSSLWINGGGISF